MAKEKDPAQAQEAIRTLQARIIALVKADSRLLEDIQEILNPVFGSLNEERGMGIFYGLATAMARKILMEKHGSIEEIGDKELKESVEKFVKETLPDIMELQRTTGKVPPSQRIN